jgi:hypothetical protein
MNRAAAVTEMGLPESGGSVTVKINGGGSSGMVHARGHEGARGAIHADDNLIVRRTGFLWRLDFASRKFESIEDRARNYED